MNWGMIAMMKKLYEGNFHKYIDDDDDDISAFFEGNLLDAIYEVTKTWNVVTSNAINKSWRKLCPDIEDYCFSFEEEFLAAKLATILKETSNSENIYSDNI
jgi:hypothetical protein